MNFSQLENGAMQGYAFVKTCDKKNAKNGSVYLDIILNDKENDIVAKLWDYRGADDEMPQPNTVILVRGLPTNFNGQQQFKIERWRNITEKDDVSIADFVPGTSYNTEQMMNEIYHIIGSFKDEQLKKLAACVIDEYRDRIIDLPAAFRLHHAVRGGLLLHTLSICRMAETAAAVYPSVDRDLLLCGAILHDVAKCVEFNLAPTGLVDSYTAEGTLVGHLVKGAMIIEEIGKANGIDENTRMLVEHMLISHHGIPEYGAAVRPLFLEAEILSELDTLDANIYEIENVIKGVDPGSFSNKVWALDERKFFNHNRKPIETEANLGLSEEQ